MPPAGPPWPPSVTPAPRTARGCCPWVGGLHGKVAAGLPGEVFSGDDRNQVPRGDPTPPGTVQRVLGSRGAVRTASSDLDLGCGVSAVLASSLLPVSFKG